MATKIRLQRHGRSKRPYYYIVVADSRFKRDGRFIDRLGDYNPLTIPATINVDFDKAFDWIMKGAEPSDTVKKILSYKGVLYKKHLARGVRKGAMTEEEMESKMQDWFTYKDAKVSDRIEKLKLAKEEDKKSRKDAETQKREDYAKKLEDALNPPVEEEVATEVEANVEATDTAEVSETPTEEVVAPAEEAASAEAPKED